MRRRRSRVSRCSMASSPPSVSTVTSGCGASARSAAGSADAAVVSPGSLRRDLSATASRPALVGAAPPAVGGAFDPLAGDLRRLRLRRGLGLEAGAIRRERPRTALAAPTLDRRGLGRGLGRCVCGASRRHLAGAASRPAHRRTPRLAAISSAAASTTGSSCVRGALLDVGAVDPVAAPARLVVVGLGRQPLLLGDQPFAVGDGDLIVVGMDFGEGQEAVAVAAIFHERRLQRRFDANDLRQVDVALEGLAARRLEIELFQSCSIDHDHPSLLGVARIDEHAPCHGLAPRRWVPYRRERPAAKPPPWYEGDGAPSTRRTAIHWPRRGSIAPPDHNWVLPTSGFL